MVIATPELERTSLLFPPRRINLPAPPAPLNELLMEVYYADQAAANELHRRYVGRVESVVKRHLNRRYRLRVDPEDVVQDVFLAVFSRLQAQPMRFASDASFGCWIGRVARNKAIKRVKFESAEKRSTDRESHGGARIGLEAFLNEKLLTNEQSPLELLAQREAYVEALESLDPTCRRIVALLEEGHSQIEIGASLGVTPRTIRRKLDRIRAEFSQRF